MQFIADITGVELRVAGAAGGSALGAAMAGMIGAGLHPPPAALQRAIGGEAVYAPAMAPAEAGRLRAGWQRAVGSVLPAQGQAPPAGDRRKPGAPLSP
jgi:glycerol kinase